VNLTGSPDPQVIRENIARAKARRDAALAEFEAASRELDWWRQVLEMFDPEAAVAEKSEEEAKARIRQLIPEGFETRDPTVRQMILFSMRADPHGDWSVERLYNMMVTHRWIDPATKDATRRITDMAALMTKDGFLERAERGVYRLPEPLAAALSRALHPITDYQLAGSLGLPVPDRQSLRPGRERTRRRQANASDVRTSETTE